MKHNMFTRTLALCVVVLFLFTTTIASAFEAARPVMGEVMTSGTVEIETGQGNWLPVKGKTLPLFDGAHLRSADGGMSLVLKDGSRVDVGKDAEIVLSGNAQNPVIQLNKGTLGFTAPGGSQFSVTTAHATVLPKVSYAGEKKEASKGLVTVDDKGTKVASVEGSLIVLDNSKVGAQQLNAGSALYAAAADTGQKVSPAAVPGEKAPVIAAADSGSSSSTLLWVGLGVLAVGGGIAAASGGGGGGGGSSSPASPSHP